MKCNVPVAEATHVEAVLPERVQEALGELVGAATEGLLELSVEVGLGVLRELLEEEVEQIVGPKGRWNPDRTTVRHGREDGEVTLGGRRVAVKRPRVRTADGAGAGAPVSRARIRPLSFCQVEERRLRAPPSPQGDDQLLADSYVAPTDGEDRAVKRPKEVNSNAQSPDGGSADGRARRRWRGNRQRGKLDEHHNGDQHRQDTGAGACPEQSPSPEWGSPLPRHGR